MVRRMLESIPAAEQIFDEPFDAVVAVRILLPIEYGEHGRHRDGVDAVLTLQQVRVVLLGEFAKRVQILERLGERDIHQMQSRAYGNLAEEIDRLGDHPRNRVDLAGLQFLQRSRLIDHDLLDIDAEPLEHDGAGEARAGASRTEIDLLAAQILQRLNVIARQNVQFRDRHPDYVLNAALKIGRFALGAEIFENVGLGDRRIDAAQVQEIVEIGRG